MRGAMRIDAIVIITSALVAVSAPSSDDGAVARVLRMGKYVHAEFKGV